MSDTKTYDVKDSASFRFLEAATRKELYEVNEFLKTLGVQNDQDGIILPEQLSRYKAEEVEREELSKALTANSNPVTAAAARLAHEANRARRDIAIAHPKLILNRVFPPTGEGNGTLLQYCCLENPMDRGAW